jgi:hypothetical protein
MRISVDCPRNGSSAVYHLKASDIAGQSASRLREVPVSEAAWCLVLSDLTHVLRITMQVFSQTALAGRQQIGHLINLPPISAAGRSAALQPDVSPEKIIDTDL